MPTGILPRRRATVVLTLSREQPDLVASGMGIDEYDREGRVLRTDLGDLTILNCYFPSGTTGDVRQAVKMRFLEDMVWANTLKQERPNLLIVGDYNTPTLKWTSMTRRATRTHPASCRREGMDDPLVRFRLWRTPSAMLTRTKSPTVGGGPFAPMPANNKGLADRSNN